MADGEVNNPPRNEMSFGISSMENHVPLVLDLDQLNYDAWCKLLTSLCESFGLLGYLDGTVENTGVNELEWRRLDSLVKMWIYGTLSHSLLQMVLKNNVSATEVRTSLENLF